MGYVEQKTKWSARLFQGFARRFKQWAYKIKDDLLEFGIESKMSDIMTNDTTIKKTGQHISPRPAVILFTKYYEEFTEFKKRWYPNGKKEIPSDIKVSPSLIANWHLGDGEYDPTTGRVGLSINSFSKTDVFLAKNKLKHELGIDPKVYPNRRQNNQPRFKFSQTDSKVFLQYIKDWIVPCFAYKWGNIN
ncbi:unnamed protein product [marine sediment metagenome]|uniref:Homing endonuclease LAGLIDADG domain-containing protein n=1 Tax=marine sediment metagenome TaxID=412755 RepID=X1CQX6_9ZZZZ